MYVVSKLSGFYKIHLAKLYLKKKLPHSSFISNLVCNNLQIRICCFKVFLNTRSGFRSHTFITCPCERSNNDYPTDQAYPTVLCMFSVCCKYIIASQLKDMVIWCSSVKVALFISGPGMGSRIESVM